MKRLLLFLFLPLVAIGAKAEPINIIPKPEKIVPLSGEFTLNEATKIIYNDGLESQAEYLESLLEGSTGWDLDTKSGKSGKRSSINLVYNTQLKKEGYTLNIDKGGITIAGADNGGVFYGIQTLLQLLPSEIYSSTPVKGVEWSAPSLFVEDAPMYQWRGMMLDVARYFYDKEFVMKYIDMMAMYKLNVLQLHLIDDSGWRLEIKKYPLLTEVGAWAGEDGKRLGGYYTQDDIREIVEYATVRNVDVIPEIAFPAHMLSAVVAYPWLSCEQVQLEVPTQHYISRDLLCVGRESSYEFLKDVFEETFALFPSKYVNIGGDEVVPEKWAKCPHCQKVMEREGLDHPQKLQGYLTNIVTDMMKEHGKTVVGWEEAVLSGRVKNKMVGVVWRNLNVTEEILDDGHYAVLCPASHTYFDFPEGRTPGEIKAAGWMPPISVEKCYSLRVSDYDKDSQILGVQGAFWSDQFIHGTVLQEFDILSENRSERYAEYLTFPRLLALAEVGWSNDQIREFNDFRSRLKYHFAKLDSKDCHYRVPEPIIKKVTDQNNGVQFWLEPSVADSKILYRTDGRYPHKHSEEYSGPVVLDNKFNFRASTLTSQGVLSLPLYFEEDFAQFKSFGTLTAQWKPELIKAKEFAPWRFQATGKISGNGTYEVTFIYTGGDHKLEIDGIKLFKRQDVISEDKHSGSTGGTNSANTYTVEVDSFEAGTPFTIEAMVRGDVGNDTNGIVMIKKVK